MSTSEGRQPFANDAKGVPDGLHVVAHSVLPDLTQFFYSSGSRTPESLGAISKYTSVAFTLKSARNVAVTTCLLRVQRKPHKLGVNPLAPRPSVGNRATSAYL